MDIYKKPAKFNTSDVSKGFRYKTINKAFDIEDLLFFITKNIKR